MKKQKFGIREFAAKHGLTLGKHCCYGVYKGFRVHVKYVAMGNPACLITVVTDTKGRDKDIEKYLEKNKKDLKLTHFGVVGIGLMVSPQLYRGIFRQVEEILDKIVAHLFKLGCPGAEICPYCGLPLEGGTIEMEESGIVFKAHASCFERAYEAAARKEEEEKNRPDKKGAALGGAFLGTLAASAAFILMFLWWNFAAIAAAVAVLLGAWLYAKFGGKNTSFKVVSVSLLSLIVMLAVFALCLFLQANADMDGFTGSVVDKIVTDVQNDAGYRNGILLNFIFIFVFDAIGAAYMLFSYLRGRKKLTRNMRRLGSAN